MEKNTGRIADVQYPIDPNIVHYIHNGDDSAYLFVNGELHESGSFSLASALADLSKLMVLGKFITLHSDRLESDTELGLEITDLDSLYSILGDVEES